MFLARTGVILVWDIDVINGISIYPNPTTSANIEMTKIFMRYKKQLHISGSCVTKLRNDDIWV
jgi:hypothetical protein